MIIENVGMRASISKAKIILISCNTKKRNNRQHNIMEPHSNKQMYWQRNKEIVYKMAVNILGNNKDDLYYKIQNKVDVVTW